MRLYSDFGPRRTRQVIADLIALALIGGWIWVGVTVGGLVAALADYGRQMEEAGAGFAQTMTEVGDNLGGVPVIGGGIRVPFDGASAAGAALEAAGRSQQEAILALATGVGIGIAALPILMILLVWLVPRLRFARRAARTAALVSAGAGVDLLALRALATQDIATLSAVDPDAMAAWRRGDESVLRRLAQLEASSAGVRLPG
jgi:hypothetical protein